MIPGAINPLMMASSGVSYLAYETFSAADNTLIEGKAADIGGTWIKASTIPSQGDYDKGKVVSNAGTIVSTSGIIAPWYGLTNLGTANMKMSVDVTMSASAGYEHRFGLRWNGVAYAANSAGTFLFCQVLTGAGVMRIFSVVNGTSTTIATSGSLTHVAGTTYTVTFEVSGTTATLTTPLGTCSGTVPASTNSGIWFGLIKVNTAASSVVDNLRVEAL